MNKSCTKCKKSLPIKSFYHKQSWCRDCKISYGKEYRKKHPFKNNPEKQKIWYLKNKDSSEFKQKRLADRLALKNSGKTKEYHKIYRLKTQYGLTAEQHAEMIDNQKSMCAICDIKSDKLHIDHDHQTKEIRYLLCAQCNLALGLIKENPRIALGLYNYIVITSHKDWGVSI